MAHGMLISGLMQVVNNRHFGAFWVPNRTNLSLRSGLCRAGMVGLVLALWLACFGANADVARTPITYMSLAYGLPAGSIFSDFQSELIETDHSWRAQFNTLFDPPPSMVDAFSPSVVLARKQLPNRYAYASWLGVHSGFGQIFAGDRIGRSRICGAGLEDACCLFLKMSFRF